MALSALLQSCFMPFSSLKVYRTLKDEENLILQHLTSRPLPVQSRQYCNLNQLIATILMSMRIVKILIS
uniref:Uncharacterized protein n=1 Tax=Lepeophtheirus salmonis TaxID=72036 RepID=A0A0K2THU5_LEPSM